MIRAADHLTNPVFPAVGMSDAVAYFSRLELPMKLLALVVLVVATFPAPAQTSSAVVIPGLGEHHHTISTKNPQAPRFFDPGLTLGSGFNHEEAARATWMWILGKKWSRMRRCRRH